MTKKLFVPDRVATGPLPKSVEKAFASAEEDKNSVDPSTMEESAMDRLPQPVGYRLLVIPYYMAAKTKGGVIIPDSTRDRESFATVAAYG